MNVVITGTDSGLGLLMFNMFRKRGHRVVGSTFDNITGDRTVDPMMPLLDLHNEMSIHRYAEVAAVLLEGKVDLVINNAGVNGIREFKDLSAPFIHEMMQVNFVAPVMLVHQLMFSANALGEGARIINIISDAAWRPMRHSLAYNCSKAALDMATKQMARELSKPYGLSIVGVRPGPMQGTEMSLYISEQVCKLRKWTPEQAASYAKQSSITGESSWAEHVASLVFHLALSPLFDTMSGASLDLVG